MFLMERQEMKRWWTNSFIWVTKAAALVHGQPLLLRFWSVEILLLGANHPKISHFYGVKDHYDFSANGEMSMHDKLHQELYRRSIVKGYWPFGFITTNIVSEHQGDIHNHNIINTKSHINNHSPMFNMLRSTRQNMYVSYLSTIDQHNYR